MKWGVIFAISGIAVVSHAQEVRRALPAHAPSLDNYQNPAWMDRLPDGQAIEVRRAESVQPATLLPSPSPEPTPPVAPATPPADPAPAVLDDPANIRIAPESEGQSRAGSALNRADHFYSRKLYDLAIPEYEAFLVADPSSPTCDGAMFRLAECHRISGNAAAARAAYERLLMQFQTGEFAAAGAYRLGEILAAEKMHQPAAMQFDLAAREAKVSEIRLSAAYLAAQNYEAIRQNQAAEERYQSVVAVKDSNPYRENAALALAALQLQLGKKNNALETCEFLVATTASPDIAARCATQAARLAAELGSTPKAIQLFEKAASASSDPAVKSEAILAVLRLRYDSGDFQAVTGMGESIEKNLRPPSRSEALGILAASWRRLGREDQAKRVYDLLVSENPRGASPEVRYQRLLSLYATKDPQLVSEVDRFLSDCTDPVKVASAGLLKAEALFAKPDFSAAATAYAPLVDNTGLKQEQRSAALYKLAWALDASGDSPGAIRAYTAFADKYPSDKLAATAVLQRGLSRQKAQAFNEALGDFDEVITRFQFSKEVEIALLQQALTLGQLKKYPEMAAAFQELLKRYPNTAAAAQANFWLGWVAFENKDYTQAVGLLDKARLLDPKNYSDRASLRILLSHYQLKDRISAAREADEYKGGAIPLDVAIWIAQGHFDDKKFARAEKLLLPLVQKSPDSSPDAWLLLSEARLALGKSEEASAAADKAVALAQDSSFKARAYLSKAAAEIALRRAPSARQAVDQALFLQPEGPINAEARLASGEVFFLEQDYDSAARAFMAVSILVDDSNLAPKALRRAADSYRRAFKDTEADKALKELADRFPASRVDLRQ